MSSKICSVCNLLKDLSCFSKNKSKIDGLQTVCKSCASDKSKVYYQNNSEKHKNNVRENNKLYRHKNQEFILEYLKEHPCIDCGENDPVVLEFDHLNDKRENISRMINNASSTDSIMLEINKCVVRCANCHRRKTAKDQGWYKL